MRAFLSKSKNKRAYRLYYNGTRQKKQVFTGPAHTPFMAKDQKTFALPAALVYS